MNVSTPPVPHASTPAYTLIYPYDLPHIGDSMHWRVRYEQKQRVQESNNAVSRG